MTKTIILSGKWLSAYNESLIECADDDNDNYNSCGYDCDDSNFRINIGTYEYPGNSLDENCDGVKVCNPQDEWKSHGEYVSCVVKEANLLYRQGLIDNKERAKIVISIPKLILELKGA